MRPSHPFAAQVWLSFGPAKLLNLNQRKGLIDVGLDADFVLFDPDAPFTVAASDLQGAPKNMLDGLDAKKQKKRLNAASLYHGFECSGTVVATILRGKLAYARGALRTTPHGRVITRHGDYHASQPPA